MSLQAAAARAKAWLFDAAFPAWAEHGFDAREGLFHEKLDHDFSPAPGPIRVRVQARQAFVFALAGKLGWNGPWRERVEAGLRALAGPGRAEDGLIGHLMERDGKLIDARRDLYDQAFALLALASGASALNAHTALARADALMDVIERLWSSDFGGFDEGEVKPLPRRQNPHMHLFEASMALIEAAPRNPRWRRLGHELAGLFDAHFFDDARGALLEYFTADWRSESDAVEPGHHFEWAWLLDQWRKSGGEDRQDAADALWDHAMAHGICARRSVAMDECFAAGGVKSETARLWPQTEWLKAALARYERFGRAGDLQAALAAERALSLYLTDKGLWRDRMKADGSFVIEPSPASSLYHIALSQAELIRVAG